MAIEGGTNVTFCSFFLDLDIWLTSTSSTSTFPFPAFFFLKTHDDHRLDEQPAGGRRRRTRRRNGGVFFCVSGSSACGTWTFFFAMDRSSDPATSKATATILLKKTFSSPPTALPEPPETHKQLDEKKYVFEVSMYLFLSWVDPRAPQEVSKATNETTAEGGRDCARALSFSFF